MSDRPNPTSTTGRDRRLRLKVSLSLAMAVLAAAAYGADALVVPTRVQPALSLAPAHLTGKPPPLRGAAPIPLPSRSGAARRPVVHAPTAILVDLRSGMVLYLKNPYRRRPIASITKIMTAMLVLEHSNLSDVVRVSRRAARAEPIKLGLRVGERITVRNLLWGLLLWSGNDAAVALAEHVSGTVPRFDRLMNKEARKLGMDETNFASPNGLNDRGRSTVVDVATMAGAALSDPTFARMVATRKHRIPGPPRQVHRLRNLNEILFRYPGATGVKTGYTTLAGNCVVASATRVGRSLLAVVLGDPARTHWRFAYADVTKLLNYGFGLQLSFPKSPG